MTCRALDAIRTRDTDGAGGAALHRSRQWGVAKGAEGLIHPRARYGVLFFGFFGALSFFQSV